MFLCRRPLLNRLFISKPSFRLISFKNTPQSTPIYIPSPTFAKNSNGSFSSNNAKSQSFYRNEDPAVSSSKLFHLLSKAVNADDKMAVGDVIDGFLHHQDIPMRNNALRRILLYIDFRLLYPDFAPKILRYLVRDDQLGQLPDYDLRRLVRRIALEYAKTPVIGDFGAALHSVIMSRLTCLESVPVGVESVSHELPILVEAAFELLHYLLMLRNEKLALELFQVLTEKLYITPAAIQQAPTSSTDFKYIVSITLARNCLYWYQHDLALRLITQYLPPANSLLEAIERKSPPLDQSQPNPPPEQQTLPEETPQSLDPEFLNSVTDILHATLQQPSLAELERSIDVICRVHLWAPVENNIIHMAYKAAHKSRFGDVARRLYAFTREPAIADEHHYPEPQGPPLLFLMSFMTEEKGNTHLARTLAQEVVKNDTGLPLIHRPNFIVRCAEQGFATSARILWERYAAGQDKIRVAGYGVLLLRMVKLFMRMARSLEVGVVLHDTEGSSSSDGLDEEIKEAQGDPIERAQDMRKFVKKLLAAFVEAHQPLKEARHELLSSLARSYFVSGDFEKGFAVFRILTHRHEIPDLHDINIGLSVLAEQRPRTAAKMIEVMMQRGVEPDSVTFATVIHHALVHRDMELVGNLLQRARQAGNIPLSRKGLFSLTRASVTFDDGNPQKKTTHLQDVLSLVKAAPSQGYLSSPDLGKYMVFACLRDDEPMIGFEFWNLLLRYSADWDDEEQVFLRKTLRKKISQTGKASPWIVDALKRRPVFYARK